MCRWHQLHQRPVKYVEVFHLFHRKTRQLRTANVALTTWRIVRKRERSRFAYLIRNKSDFSLHVRFLLWYISLCIQCCQFAPGRNLKKACFIVKITRWAGRIKIHSVLRLAKVRLGSSCTLLSLFLGTLAMDAVRNADLQAQNTGSTGFATLEGTIGYRHRGRGGGW